MGQGKAVHNTNMWGQDSNQQFEQKPKSLETIWTFECWVLTSIESSNCWVLMEVYVYIEKFLSIFRVPINGGFYHIFYEWTLLWSIKKLQKYLKIVYLNYTHRLVPIGHSKGQRVTFLLRLQFWRKRGQEKKIPWFDAKSNIKINLQIWPTCNVHCFLHILQQEMSLVTC